MCQKLGGTSPIPAAPTTAGLAVSAAFSLSVCGISAGSVTVRFASPSGSKPSGVERM